METDGGAADPAGSVWSRLGPALAVLFALAPLLLCGGERIDEEAAGFLQKNWSDRGALEEIFDVRGWDFYQGRELSYAVDWLDGQWVRLLLSRGIVRFDPPSGLVASLAFVWIGVRLAPRALPDLAPSLRWLALLLPMSSFAFLSSMGILYRATKPLVAPLLLAMLLLALAEHRRPRLSRPLAFALMAWGALLLGLLDRQGLFYLLALCAALFLGWLHRRRGMVLLAGAIAGALAWWVYFRLIAPPLIHALEGYWPSLRFQRLRPERLFAPALWREAASVLADWTAVLAGGLPGAVVLALLSAGLLVWAWRERRRPALVALCVTAAVAGLAGQLAMVVMMLERHPPVSWLSHRVWYYPLPYHAVATFGLLWFLDRLPRLPILRTAAAATLAGLVALNVVHWASIEASLASEPFWNDLRRRSELVVRSLRQGHAAPLLDGDHRRLYFDCLDVSPRLAAAARAQVSEDQGVLRPRLVDGRVLAPVRKEAHFLARTPEAGRFVLAGRLRVRAGESVELLAGAPPRSLHRLTTVEGGWVGLHLPLELGAGITRITLLSHLAEQRIPGEPRRARAGYEAQLPLLLLPR